MGVSASADYAPAAVVPQYCGLSQDCALGVFKVHDEAGLSDTGIREDSECRDLLLWFSAYFPAFVEARVEGVLQGRNRLGPVARSPGRRCGSTLPAGHRQSALEQIVGRGAPSVT